MSLSISIVTPNYNMARYLRGTIESALCNLHDNDEYIVIDGGSTDGSREILGAYASRLTRWVSEPDQGYADAIAKGFSTVKGDVLCWINSGDLFLSGALDVVRHTFAHTDADIIFGDDFYIDENDRVISFSRGHVDDLRSAMLYGGWTPLQDACFWRRDLYHRIGGIDRKIRYAADYDLFLRMAINGRAQYVPTTFSAFRRHFGQKSIAGGVDYRAERQIVRKRELARIDESPLMKSTRCMWHSAAIRWRVHALQRFWTRPDLRGRHISNLSCEQYWPPNQAAKGR